MDGAGVFGIVVGGIYVTGATATLTLLVFKSLRERDFKAFLLSFAWAVAWPVLLLINMACCFNGHRSISQWWRETATQPETAPPPAVRHHRVRERSYSTTGRAAPEAQAQVPILPVPHFHTIIFTTWGWLPPPPPASPHSHEEWTPASTIPGEWPQPPNV